MLPFLLRAQTGCARTLKLISCLSRFFNEILLRPVTLNAVWFSFIIFSLTPPCLSFPSTFQSALERSEDRAITTFNHRIWPFLHTLLSTHVFLPSYGSDDIDHQYLASTHHTLHWNYSNWPFSSPFSLSFLFLPLTSVLETPGSS